MNHKLLLVGGGGHCKSVLDCLGQNAVYDKIGLVDLPDKLGQTILGIPIIGCDDDLPRLLAEGFTHAFVTLGSVGNACPRISLMALLAEIGYNLPNIVDSTAVVSRYANLGKGIFVGKNAVINAGASIGDGAIINTGAIIEHDCQVGSFAHLAPSSILCGEVFVGEAAHIGAGSVIRQKSKIGARTMIGLGSVVVRDIPADTTAMGNPCRVVKKS